MHECPRFSSRLKFYQELLLGFGAVNLEGSGGGCFLSVHSNLTPLYYVEQRKGKQPAPSISIITQSEIYRVNLMLIKPPELSFLFVPFCSSVNQFCIYTRTIGICLWCRQISQENAQVSVKQKTPSKMPFMVWRQVVLQVLVTHNKGPFWNQRLPPIIKCKHLPHSLKSLLKRHISARVFPDHSFLICNQPYDL